jgi:transcriptional regulator with XRE-family HTH domain
MERGFSLRKLAEVSGCSLQTICNVESGISGGTTTVLRQIARALQVRLFDLFNVNTQTDDVGFVLERIRVDPDALRLTAKLCTDRKALSKMRTGSSVPIGA